MFCLLVVAVKASVHVVVYKKKKHFIHVLNKYHMSLSWQKAEKPMRSKRSCSFAEGYSHAIHCWQRPTVLDEQLEPNMELARQKLGCSNEKAVGYQDGKWWTYINPKTCTVFNVSYFEDATGKGGKSPDLGKGSLLLFWLKKRQAKLLKLGMFIQVCWCFSFLKYLFKIVHLAQHILPKLMSWYPGQPASPSTSPKSQGEAVQHHSMFFYWKGHAMQGFGSSIGILKHWNSMKFSDMFNLFRSFRFFQDLKDLRFVLQALQTIKHKPEFVRHHIYISYQHPILHSYEYNTSLHNRILPAHFAVSCVYKYWNIEIPDQQIVTAISWVLKTQMLHLNQVQLPVCRSGLRV